MARDEANGIVAAEILFAAPLHRGETAIVQYALRHPGPPYARSDDSYCRNFHLPVREYVVQMQFDPRALPSYGEQFQLDRSEHVTVRRPLEVDALGNAHAVALDFGPGSFCVRWEWPAGRSLTAIE